MLYSIARLLQLTGLIILPIAMAGNMANKLDLWPSLQLSGAGIITFFFGYVLQRWAKPK